MAGFEPKPFGKYFLVERLAIGGMAEIYKAKTFGVDGFEKLLAIKKILPHYSADSEFIAMLTDEAKLVVRLSHTNIVQIYDLGKVGDDYYISMEFIDGINLRELITREKELNEKIPLPVCLYITSEICKGLDYAHNKRDDNGSPLFIVHRDVSPQNILISFEGETKIVDFGIAKAAMNISHTTSGILKGKITYMSPEHALGKPVDARTDIFSTGLLLYELITGERLFTGETQLEVLKKIRTTLVTETILGGIPETIRPVLAKSLAYQQKNRYETAGDFQVALTKMLYSEYSDFSPRHLSALIKKWFAPELKIKKRQAEENIAMDFQTQAVLANPANQQSIVASDSLKPGETVILQDTTKPESGIRPSQFVHGNAGGKTASSFKKNLALAGGAVIIAALTAVGLYYFSRPAPMPPAGKPVEIDKSVNSDKPPEIISNAPKIIVEPPDSPEKIVAPEEITLGSLEIRSEPSGAQIIVDGRDTGLLTPGKIERLEMHKNYHVELRKNNYAVKDIPVELKEETPVNINAVLDLLPVFRVGKIRVGSNVDSARVLVNGRPMGYTDEMFEVEPGNVKVALSKTGYKSAEKTVTISGGETREITINLATEKEEKKATMPQKEPAKKTGAVKAKPEIPPRPEERQKSTATEGGLGEVRLDSSPRGAGVVVNGKKAGITPIIVPRLEKNRSHTVVLTLPGYKTWTKEFKLGQNRVELTAQMQKE